MKWIHRKGELHFNDACRLIFKEESSTSKEFLSLPIYDGIN